MNLVFTPVIVALSNGLRVANFSSPHSFEFVDGSVLPAVSDDIAKSLSMDATELRYRYSTYGVNGAGPFYSIKLSFEATKDVLDSINYWFNLWNLEDLVDVVIVPLPVITMMRNTMNYDDERLYNSPFRTIRVADRITKKICIDKFCI